MKHTEGKWVIQGFGDRLIITPEDKSDIITAISLSSIDETRDRDNAQRIVTCVNCHDDLLEACKHALRVFELYKNHPQMDTIREMLSKVITKAEAIK